MARHKFISSIRVDSGVKPIQRMQDDDVLRGNQRERRAVVLADGRLTSGTQVTVGRKITLHGEGRHVFVAASGLRSVRDTTLPV